MASEVLSYKFPKIDLTLPGNSQTWASYAPINGNGGIYRSDQSTSIVFNIASNSQFLSTVKSLLSANIVPRDATGAVVTSAATTITNQGVSRAFSRMQIRFGGAVVDTINFYNDILARVYSTETLGRKSMLTRLEGYQNPAFLQGGSTEFAHMLYSSLLITPQLLPLPILGSSGGGLSIELWLAPVNEVFTSTNVDHYTLENVKFWSCMVTPPASYTLGLIDSISKGSTATIAYQQIHTFPSNGNGSNTQIINVPIGAKSSIASVESVFWDQTAYAASDKYQRFNNFGLQSWNIVANNQPNPNQLTFNYSAGSSPQTMLINFLSQYGNIYDLGREISLPNNWDTQSFSVGLNYQAVPGFGSGMSTVGSASPFIVVTTNHNQAVPTTVNILTTVVCDAVIVLSGAGVSVTEIF